MSTHSSGPDRQTDMRRGAVGVLVKEKELGVPRAPDIGLGCTLANMLDTTQLHSATEALIKRRATKTRPPGILSLPQ